MISLDSEFRAKSSGMNLNSTYTSMTPIIKGDYLYAIAGRHQRGAEVFFGARTSCKVLPWRN